MVNKCQLLFFSLGWLLPLFNLWLCQSGFYPKMLPPQSVAVTTAIHLPWEVHLFSWILKALVFKNLLFSCKCKEVYHGKLLSVNTLAGISCHFRGNWYLQYWWQREERIQHWKEPWKDNWEGTRAWDSLQSWPRAGWPPSPLGLCLLFRTLLEQREGHPFLCNCVSHLVH